MADHPSNGGISDLSVIGRSLERGLKKILSKKKGEKKARKMKKEFLQRAEEKPERIPYVEPMQVGYKSDVGMIRSLDEDSIAVLDFSSFSESRDIKKIFAVVADGMGGHSKGEVASQLATKTISESVSPLILKKDVERKLYEEALWNGFLRANQNIIDHTLSHPECIGMGTTASAALIDGAKLYVGHVGDTRVYVIKEKITQITKDHSLVQELLDQGEITAEQARNHPQKNVITRAIGVGSNLEVDLFERTLEEGDYVLLCCDGLVNEVEDAEIMQIVLDSTKVQDACDELVNLANKRGGRDNISVIGIGPIKIPEVKVETEAIPSTQPIPKPFDLDIAPPSGPESKWCPNCGQPNKPLATRCFSCDAELEEDAIDPDT